MLTFRAITGRRAHVSNDAGWFQGVTLGVAQLLPSSPLSAGGHLRDGAALPTQAFPRWACCFRAFCAPSPPACIPSLHSLFSASAGTPLSPPLLWAPAVSQYYFLGGEMQSVWYEGNRLDARNSLKQDAGEAEPWRFLGTGTQSRRSAERRAGSAWVRMQPFVGLPQGHGRQTGRW